MNGVGNGVIYTGSSVLNLFYVNVSVVKQFAFSLLSSTRGRGLAGCGMNVMHTVTWKGIVISLNATDL